jgi:hypothetical protein
MVCIPFSARDSPKSKPSTAETRCNQQETQGLARNLQMPNQPLLRKLPSPDINIQTLAKFQPRLLDKEPNGLCPGVENSQVAKIPTHLVDPTPQICKATSQPEPKIHAKHASASRPLGPSIRSWAIA